MSNNLELQREATIEIVGTQYEGRATNHQPLFLQQNLILKHQSNNPYDRNAVLLLTNDAKELGFLPKGYASIYAPAIDEEEIEADILAFVQNIVNGHAQQTTEYLKLAIKRIIQ